jgi:hypothetical protein
MDELERVFEREVRQLAGRVLGQRSVDGVPPRARRFFL